MDLREFMRFHLLKALLGLVAIQIIIVAIVQNYNHRPVALRDTATMIEGRTVKITPLTNDTDKDENNELSVKKVLLPLHGKVEQKGNIVFYSPDAGFVGTDSVAYTTTDGKKESAEAYIAVVVNKNLEPIAGRDITETYNQVAIVIDVLKNDSDREGDSIYINSFTQPKYGKLELIEKQLVYKTGNTTAKIDSFRYLISDGMNLSDSASVVINIKPTSDPSYPWLSTDVGDAAIPGSSANSDGKFAIQASGSDIWNATDGFNYTYQYVVGDFEMVTKVESIEGTHEWAKAGIMARESMNAGSRCAFVCLTNRNGGACSWRTEFYEQMSGGPTTGGIAAPYWIKLVRKGNNFGYFISADSKNWSNISNSEVKMPAKVYLGFALTSHNNGELAKAVYSNYKISGKTATY
jgi:hypothetical protein